MNLPFPTYLPETLIGIAVIATTCAMYAQATNPGVPKEEFAPFNLVATAMSLTGLCLFLYKDYILKNAETD